MSSDKITDTTSCLQCTKHTSIFTSYRCHKMNLSYIYKFNSTLCNNWLIFSQLAKCSFFIHEFISLLATCVQSQSNCSEKIIAPSRRFLSFLYTAQCVQFKWSHLLGAMKNITALSWHIVHFNYTINLHYTLLIRAIYDYLNRAINILWNCINFGCE